jgi:1,4-dihydroxy-2-naphthoate octaprenyltransferase
MTRQTDKGAPARAGFSAWIEAFRLRTLPLALSAILLGSLLAAGAGTHRWVVTALAVLTTIFLQVLSNLANDYGDGVKGTDDDRIGPARAVQSGVISPAVMRRGMFICAALALVSGVMLVLYAFLITPVGVETASGLQASADPWSGVVAFLILGGTALAAAVLYTVGRFAYGYYGLGDLFVFLFFGWTGVGGTWYLHTLQWDPWILLPASAVGLLSAGVLNLNNLRDRATDSRAGKHTLVVRIGEGNARIYHSLLLGGAVVLGVAYALHDWSGPWQLAFLLTVPLLAANIYAVWTLKAAQLDPQLRKLAFATLLFSLSFGAGQWLA